MTWEQLLILALAVAGIAFLYSSVGHAGASGYIAAMTLCGLAPAVVKPTALALNILVASIATWQFRRAGHFSWPLFWPFALLAVPLAFVGGYLDLPLSLFKPIVGIALLASAAHLLIRPPPDEPIRMPSRAGAVAVGGGLGLLAGLTGTGGGIFLTPLLLFRRCAKAQSAAAVSALFILLNSGAGLLGSLSSAKALPPLALDLGAAVVVGGTAGSYLGSTRFPHTAIKRCLAAVLVVAGGKLLWV